MQLRLTHVIDIPEYTKENADMQSFGIPVWCFYDKMELPSIPQNENTMSVFMKGERKRTTNQNVVFQTYVKLCRLNLVNTSMWLLESLQH